jgi:hypothetical protein
MLGKRYREWLGCGRFGGDSLVLGPSANPKILKSRDSAQPQRTDLQTESLFLSLFVQTLVIGAIVF